MVYKLGQYLKQLRGKESLRSVSDRVDRRLSHSYISEVEKGVSNRGNTVNPTPETLKILSEAYDADYNYLMELAGYIEPASAKEIATIQNRNGAKDQSLNNSKSNSASTGQYNYWDLTKKDERNIQKDLENILGGLDNESAFAFMKNGESELSEEDAALLRASLEQTLILSKELAKQKFTPKKYRNNK